MLRPFSAADAIHWKFQPVAQTAAPRAATLSAGLALGGPHFSSLQAEARAHQRLYELDSQLPRVLAEMAPGCSPQDLPRLMYSNQSGILAFDDSWTLYAWSVWWTQHCAADPSLEVVVLHVDDHRDLVSPLLAKVQSWIGARSGQWTDVLTGAPVSLADAGSVASGILSGAVGIGTFMAPFIHSLRRVEIRHLHPLARESSAFLLLPSIIPDARLLPIAGRLSLEQRPPDASRKSASLYQSTSDVREWLRDIPRNARVLLHIDFDYFNDFYGGGRPLNQPEPSEDEMQNSIESLCRALEQDGLCRRIENTALAFSPGFCPSRHWNFLLSNLRRGLERSGCLCP